MSLIRQVLQCLLFRLLDEQRRPNTRQHEKRKYLQPAPTHATSAACLAYNSNNEHAQMTKKMVRLRIAPDILQVRKPDLRDDSAELPARGRDTVRGGAIARREDLAGNDERGRVRAEVLEEVREAVEYDERGPPARR